MLDIRNCDCMELMKEYPDKHFELAIVDPPYGIGEDGSKNHTRGKLAVAKDYKSFHGKDIKPPSNKYFIELKRVSKNQIIWGANHFISKIPFDSSCWIVWDKNNTGDFADCELAWTSFKTAVRKFKYTWNGMLQEDMTNKEKRIHPCLPAGEAVFFGGEWKKIEAVQIGDINRYGYVSEISEHYAEKLVEIICDESKTIATWNHPFLVKRGAKIYWLNADQIQEKDVVLSLVSVYNTQKPTLKEKISWRKNIKKPKRDTSDLQKMMTAGYEWNIALFGKNIMDKCRSVCKSITRILTKRTIIFPIYNLSRPLKTSGCTLVVDLSTVDGKSRALYVASIRLAIKIIGIFRGDGLTEGSVKNASSKSHLQQERFLSQKVGSVKIIRKKTKVYNLTMDGIPAFDTVIGISHNTQKPVALYEWLLAKYAKKGDKILDTHGGSMSIAIAAWNLGFDLTLCELDKYYYDAATKRITFHQAQKRMF